MITLFSLGNHHLPKVHPVVGRALELFQCISVGTANLQNTILIRDIEIAIVNDVIPIVASGSSVFSQASGTLVKVFLI